MTKGITITWDFVAKVAGGITAVLVLAVMLGNGALWALEHHFDDRYLLVASTYTGEMRKINKEIYLLEKDPNADQDDLDFLYEQREQIQADIDKAG